MDQFIQQIKNDLVAYRKKITRFGDAKDSYNKLLKAAEDAIKSKSDKFLGQLCFETIRDLGDLKAGSELSALLIKTLDKVGKGIIKTYDFVLSSEQDKAIKARDITIKNLNDELTTKNKEIENLKSEKTTDIQRLAQDKANEILRIQNEKQIIESKLQEEKSKLEKLEKEKQSLITTQDQQLILSKRQLEQTIEKHNIEIAQKMSELQIFKEQIEQKERSLILAQSQAEEGKNLVKASQKHESELQDMFRQVIITTQQSQEKIEAHYQHMINQQIEGYKAMEAQKNETNRALQLVIEAQKNTIEAEEKATKAAQDAYNKSMDMLQILMSTLKVALPINQEKHTPEQSDIGQKKQINNNNIPANEKSEVHKEETLQVSAQQKNLNPIFTPTVPKEEEKEDLRTGEDSDFEQLTSTTSFNTPEVAPSSTPRTNRFFGAAANAVSNTVNGAISLMSRTPAATSPAAPSSSIQAQSPAPIVAANDADTNGAAGVPAPAFGSGQ